jgi:hypothetical protein
MARPKIVSGGLNTGSNAFVDQRESDRLQRALATDFPPIQVCTWGGQFFDPSQTTYNAWVADTLYLVPLQFMARSADVSNANISVSVIAGGTSTLRIALYTKVNNQSSQLNQIAGTVAVFNGNSTTGVLTYALPRVVSVPEGALVYMCWLFTGSIPTLAGSPAVGTGSFYPVQRDSVSTYTDLPRFTTLSRLSSVSIAVPSVTYKTPLLEVV